MEASLDLQKAIRNRLVATSAVTALVPATSIIDRNSRPEGMPCILIGEAHTQPDDGLARNRHEVFADLHLWKAETGLAGVKQLAAAIREALTEPLRPDHHKVADLYIASSRFMRDPDGIHAHAVITLHARLVEAVL